MALYQYGKEKREFIERSCVPLAVYQFIDKRVVTVALSDGFCELFGLTREEAPYLMDHNMYRDTHPDDLARTAEAAFRFAVNDEPYNVVYRSKRRGGYMIVHAHGKHIYTETGERLAVVWYDDEGDYVPYARSFASGLSQSLNHMLHEETLYQTNHYDRLTGLPTMDYFFELAEAARNAAAERGERLAILFFDLSGMKYFNGKYGFSEGDKLIKAVGRILAEQYSNENCSRVGQDHFAVFTGADGVEEGLGEVLEACEKANDGNSLPVRVGVYLDQADGLDISIACDRAKAACDLNTKKFFSGITYFSFDMLTNVEHRQHIVTNLDRALREGWVEVHYQPIVRAANGRVSDEEALARWNEPGHGMLSPADFVPILEDEKLVYKLDLYVLEQALKKMRRFYDAGFFIVPTSINLSRADFEVCDIVEEVRRRVDKSGVPREKVTIEITESVIGKDLEFMKRQVKRFQELGFAVWMDDFGSGYSSLDLLQSIRFDLIKFDMMFMRKFDQGDQGKIILTELIKMAIGLGVETVAEGVETKEQAEFLREVGCNKLQGFYYSRPNSETQVLERYEQGIQIGFENPAEEQYYKAIGGVNLYDMSIVTHEDLATFGRYFDTIPLAILELQGEELSVSRCNKAYRELIDASGLTASANGKLDLLESMDEEARTFFRAVQRCAQDGERILVDIETETGDVLHPIIKRVAVNPVNGAVAVAVAVIQTKGLS